MQDSNVTNLKPNPNPNPNVLTLTVNLVRSLIRTNQSHHSRKSPLCFQNNFCCLAIDLQSPANSQN